MVVINERLCDDYYFGLKMRKFFFFLFKCLLFFCDFLVLKFDG